MLAHHTARHTHRHEAAIRFARRRAVLLSDYRTARLCGAWIEAREILRELAAIRKAV